MLGCERITSVTDSEWTDVTMPPSRSSTVYVPRAGSSAVFHTSLRCRHCPPSSRALSRASAHDAGFTECETCYEDRIHETDVPFVLFSPPQVPVCSPVSRVDPADD